MNLAEIARRCGTVAQRDYGIEVVDVQLRGFDFPKQNRLRLYARMKSERGRISMLYRSEGEEEGLKVRAAAEEQKARILGKAIELFSDRGSTGLRRGRRRGCADRDGHRHAHRRGTDHGAGRGRRNASKPRRRNSWTVGAAAFASCLRAL